ncbi:MAG: thioredoxin family protein [bacterium]
MPAREPDTLEEYYRLGLTYQELTRLTLSKPFNYQTNFNRTDLTEEDRRFFAGLPTLKTILIAEPWCGDVVSILPVIARAFDGHDQLETRVLLRSKYPRLIERYLSKGKRSVPKAVFLDENYREIAVWGPRPLAAQEIYDRYADISSTVVRDTVLFVKIKEFYRIDRGREVLDELKGLLRPFLRSC